MKRLSLAALAAALLAAIGLFVVQATSHNTVSTEVRISARQLDDGRTEFALQQVDGSDWGERQLARARYLPADVGHDRWLNSSPYEVSIEVPAQPAADDSALRTQLSTVTAERDLLRIQLTIVTTERDSLRTQLAEALAQQDEVSTEEPESPGLTPLNPDMEQAGLWVVLYADRFGRLEVTLQSATDFPTFGIDVIIAAGGRSWTMCNADPIVSGIPTALGCASPTVDHDSVNRVAAVVEERGHEPFRFDCIRHNDSNAEESVWACQVRLD